MIRIVDAAHEDVFAILRERTIRRDIETQRIVAEIIDEVRKGGDKALLHSARRFDCPNLDSIVVSQEELEAAELPENQTEAIRHALKRIQDFHEEQAAALFKGWATESTQLSNAQPRLSDDGADGSYVWGAGQARAFRLHTSGVFREGCTGQRVLPVQRAGVYVPGGKANYPSSVLMNVGPANVARVPEVFVCSPATEEGSLPPSVLVALREAAVTQAFKIGGAAAIAALALGTESVPRVDKIVGPGNRFVNEAKRQLWGHVGLDGYAGPSEVCVVADGSANPSWAAADLITQIEHSEDNAGFLIAFNEFDLKQILAEVWEQMKVAPRQNLIRRALGCESLAIIATDLNHACEIVDAIAPEHLSLMVRNPDRAMSRIRNAGCILLGDHTPQSAADWIIGPSHTLPTAGGARFGSPVNVLDFLKVQSVSRMTRQQLLDLMPTIEAFGEMEGFPSHAMGARIRFLQSD